MEARHGRNGQQHWSAGWSNFRWIFVRQVGLFVFTMQLSDGYDYFDDASARTDQNSDLW